MKYFKQHGYRYDPKIYAKSGGMASFSTYPVDTHPDMGFMNYPYVHPRRWRRRPHMYGGPFRNNSFWNSGFSRSYYKRPWFSY